MRLDRYSGNPLLTIILGREKEDKMEYQTVREYSWTMAPHMKVEIEEEELEGFKLMLIKVDSFSKVPQEP